MLFRRRQELSAPGAPFGVHRRDVSDPDIEEAADPVGIAWRLQGDRRLVVGWASANIDDDPAIGQPDRSASRPMAWRLGLPGEAEVLACALAGRPIGRLAGVSSYSRSLEVTHADRACFAALG